jgi:1-acyl-sn-glycerol-3-phosphate acyltransferase
MFYKVTKMITKAIFSLMFRVKINGYENFPEGSFMLCANHTSNWDPAIIVAFIKRKVHFLGKAELFKNPVLKYILTKAGMIPIKRGQADLGAIKSAISVLNEGNVLGIFPSGRRNKILEKGQAKSGAALIGARCGCKVVPVSIISTYKLFSKITINIGKPIDLSEHKGKKLESDKLQEIADNIYDEILELAKK